MPRIPDDVIARLKREVSLQRLFEQLGVKLKRVGKDLVGHCVWHDDTTESLVITPSSNLYHCFGCQTGGSVIDFIQKVHGVSFRHAVEMLLNDAYSPSEAAAEVKRSTVKRLPPPVESDAGDPELLRQVVAFYHETLKQSPEALEYLKARGLDSPEMIERFQLGYANRTLGYRLPEKNRKDGAELRGRLTALGIYRDSGHEHFNGSLVVPVIDEQGHVTEIYGRKIRSDLREGTPLHLYLRGPHRGVWNVEALQSSKEIILCEALLDGLTFWCAGYRNVTTSYGIEGFTSDHLEAFERHGTKRILIAYDRDEAGEKAAERLAEKLVVRGLQCYRIQFPKGMDANEYALKVKPADKGLGILIRKAAWLGNGKAPAEPIAIEQPAADQEEETAAKREAASPSAADREILASPEPRTTLPAVAVAIRGAQVHVELGDRVYRARGLPKEPTHERMSVTLTVTRVDAGDGDEVSFTDRLDLVLAKHRESYAEKAAAELGIKPEVVAKDLAKVFNQLEQVLEDEQQRRLAAEDKTVKLSDEEKAAAMTLLKDPRLLESILEDFERCGVVGEETNKLTGYLAAVSRKLKKPLGVIIQSSSAAGKSALMEALLAFLPEEEQEKYSAVTGQSLFYMSDIDLRHKVLAIVEEEGAERATYALKLLQSEGELTIASTGKDAETGKLTTREYHVEGPVMILLTTTAVEIDEELLNRCIVLTVDEDREQTRAIHRLQRERHTLAGLLAADEREEIVKRQQNLQRLLAPVRVANPFAPSLTFLDDRTRTRRDHMKYLTLIETVALLHQHQRELKQHEHRGKPFTYIEVTLEDIALANLLAHEVLGRSLDELAPQTRRLLLLLDELVTKECQRRQVDRTELRFSRREVREATGWGLTQLRIHLARLVELEYLLVHHGGRGQSFEYELVYDGRGREGAPFVSGLIEVEKLAAICGYDVNLAGLEGRLAGLKTRLAGSKRVQSGLLAGGWRSRDEARSPLSDNEVSAMVAGTAENAVLGRRSLGDAGRSPVRRVVLRKVR